MTAKIKLKVAGIAFGVALLGFAFFAASQQLETAPTSEPPTNDDSAIGSSLLAPEAKPPQRTVFLSHGLAEGCWP